MRRAGGVYRCAMEPDHPLRRALPMFLLAGLCFSTLDATAKWLIRDHTLFIIVWARYAGQMPQRVFHRLIVIRHW